VRGRCRRVQLPEEKKNMMMDSKIEMFRNRLTKVYKHLGKQAVRQGITCYRVYDHDLPEFPFCIEFYGDRLYIAEYRRNHHLDDAAHEAQLNETLAVITEILKVPEENIFLKERKRKEDRQSQYGKFGEGGSFFTVMENGLTFLVNLEDYLDTGLFLDHRITRQMVRDGAKDKHMLNLFCYTGSFSVYAAAGGAASVTSIDLSNTYIEWAANNLKINDLYNGQQHPFIKADVLQYLDTLPDNHYQLVVLDPPTFSNSKMMKDFFDVQRDHVRLMNQVLQKMTTGGTLYFSTNYTKFILDTAAIKAAEIKDITRQTTPFDFEKKLKRWCYRVVK
jgi:23S rRNA (cytosine1962-C5)-methyltransferase